MKKVAVLDTDFISKLHKVLDENGNRLIDKVLELPFSFYCHNQNLSEIKKDTQAAGACWLLEKIENKEIICYTDLDLLKLLQKKLGNSSEILAIKFFNSYLSESCSIFDSKFFDTYYSRLEICASFEQFIVIIEECESKIGKDKNLGEIKDGLLINCLRFCFSEIINNFCSDDSRARKAIADFGKDKNIQCISAFGFFNVGINTGILTEQTSFEFFNGWKSTFPKVKTLKIKHYKGRKYPDYEKWKIDDIFNGIINGSIDLDADGYLSISTKP